jgi:hypothetical protein
MTQPQQPPPLPYASYGTTPAPPKASFGRGLFGWVLFIGVAVLMFILLQSPGRPRVELPLSDFDELLAEGEVTSVTVEGDRLVYDLRTARPDADGKLVRQFRTRLPPQMSGQWAFVQWLLDNRRGADVRIKNDQNLLLNILVPLIPWFLIFGFLWFFVFRQLRRAQIGPVTLRCRRSSRMPRRPPPINRPRFAEPMRRRTSLTLPLLSLAVVASAIGCGGYRSGGAADDDGGYKWSGLYRPDVRTVAVPIFTSTSFDRGVEMALSKAVVNHLEATTPYKVAPRERADTVLEGQVVDVAVSPLSTDRNAGIPQEQMLSLTVDFTWKDLRSGQILVQRRGFAQTATYYPTLGEGRFVGRQQAVEKLAIGIVQELQTDW